MKITKEYINEDGTPFSKEQFINKIKTDDEFAKTWGELGPIYGKQWRSWREGKYTNELVMDGLNFPDGLTYWKEGIDQIQNLINDLKTNPDSRRLMVTAWNPAEVDDCVLPPCHYGFQVYTRELTWEERSKLLDTTNGPWDSIAAIGTEMDRQNLPKRAISLMFNQRSVDAPLGLPFNIASYGLLLEIVSKMVNMVPEELIGNLGDVHIYKNQIDGVKEQIGRKLSLDERIELASSDKNFDPGDFGIGLTMTEEHCHKVCDKYGVPHRTREPYPLPTLNINTEFWPYEGGSCGEGPLDAIAVFNAFKDDNFCKCLLEEDIQLSDYESHPSIKIPLSN